MESTNPNHGLNPSGLIAVHLPDQAEGACGAVTWWALAGTMDGERLSATWKAAGLDEKLLPPLPSPGTAIRRALGEQRSARRLVRPLEGTHGLALVNEQATGEELLHAIELRATVDKVGNVRVTPADHVLAAELKAAYEKHLGELSHEDISSWLCDLIHVVRATSLRESGGFYFVPPGESLAVWRKMVAVLTACSGHQVFEMPAMRSDQAVAAVLAAVSREASAEAHAMEAELSSEELGRRALQTRERRCQTAMQKLAAYEGLLGSALDELKDRFEDLQQQIAAAALAADDESEAAS
jgi:hypothetical protein